MIRRSETESLGSEHRGEGQTASGPEAPGLHRRPLGLRRLFRHDDEGSLDDPAHRLYVVARVLDRGDSSDLAWLFGTASREEIEAAVRLLGCTMDRRSRSLWALELGSGAAGRSHATWPL